MLEIVQETTSTGNEAGGWGRATASPQNAHNLGARRRAARVSTVPPPVGASDFLGVRLFRFVYGATINFLIYPQVEVACKPRTKFEKRFRFENVDLL
jgi:hypothetical protein